jgi:MinD-like ATPase involved in chromosome partitioning or flagellar assembly
VERTENGWSRSGESTPRWRTLLDRALLGGRTEAPEELDTMGDFARAGGYERALPGPRSRRGDGRYPQPIEWQPAQSNSVDQLASLLRGDLGQSRVLAFANPKGGVHKTTATALAAATIGAVRGEGVIAWDDNELRGTLGLRAGSARHARTIRHLIADLALVEVCEGQALKDRIDDYLRHAADGSYDVLAGEENPRFAQRLDPYTVRRVIDLLCRTHDVVCVDTGNNVESANWQTVLQVADQLVITTVPREDAAFTADWMLDILEEGGMAELVAGAVTVMSCPTPNPSPLIDDLTAHFRSRTRAVVVVPYDPVLESGSSIEYGELHATTRGAWLRASATILEPFMR